MSARRRPAGRRRTSPQQVRNRGLLVITLLLIGGFAVLLAYIKVNSPVAPEVAALTPAEPARQQPAAEAPATTPPTPLKPKYDFYEDLPKRQLVIDKSELGQTPKPARASQLTEPAEQTSAADAEPAPTEPAALADRQQNTGTKPQPEIVMPKIELVSLAGRSSRKQTEGSDPGQTQAAPTATEKVATRGNYLIQAGAYSRANDAERARAKLGQLGVRAYIEVGISNGNPVHRVRIGPLADEDEAQRLQARLRSNDISSMLIKRN